MLQRILNRSHSLVLEDVWSATQHVAHTLRVHLLNHRLGTFARDAGLAIRRPSITRGVTNPDGWDVPVTRLTVSNALYVHRSRSDFKMGGEMTLGTHDQDSRVFENGFFEFGTDEPFDSAKPATWPTAFTQQNPVTVTYRSQEFGLFAQNDWVGGAHAFFNASGTPGRRDKYLRMFLRSRRLGGSALIHANRKRSKPAPAWDTRQSRRTSRDAGRAAGRIQDVYCASIARGIEPHIGSGDRHCR